MATTSFVVDYDILKRVVFDVTGLKAMSVDQLSRDENRRSLEITLENGQTVLCSLLGVNVPSYIISSEVATMRYVRDHTSIPVPRVLAYETDASHPLGPYLLVDNIPGVPLDIVLPKLSSNEQDLVVAQIAKWTAKLFRHRFEAIGSLLADSRDGYLVGPIVRRRFFTEGRMQLRLDRGPYSTTKDYLLACAQREIDCARTLIAQDASLTYQRDLEDCRLQVDQSMLLMTDLIHRCQGLDEGDSNMAPFTLDFHEMPLKDFLTSEKDPTKIIAVAGWDCIATMPLWQCGRLPKWLQTSMSDGDDDTKVRLAAIFRHVMWNEDGRESLIARALVDEGSTRCSLHDLCDYDAFKDGFLLRPALESIVATLPGEEDMEGLSAILDPSTVTGRVARISLMTSGSAGDAMTLAFADSDMKDHTSHRRQSSLTDPVPPETLTGSMGT